MKKSIVKAFALLTLAVFSTLGFAGPLGIYTLDKEAIYKNLEAAIAQVPEEKLPKAMVPQALASMKERFDVFTFELDFKQDGTVSSNVGIQNTSETSKGNWNLSGDQLNIDLLVDGTDSTQSLKGIYKENQIIVSNPVPNNSGLTVDLIFKLKTDAP